MIDSLETFDNPTTSYDRALAENVLDSLMLVITIPNPIHNPLSGTLCSEVPFSFAHEYSSNGFSSSSQRVLVDAVLARIQTQPETGKRVAGLKLDMEVSRERAQVTVTLNHEAQPRVYGHVMSTLPFGLVGARGFRMPYTLRQAIQSLQYVPPIKVAMRFLTRWRTTLENHRGCVSRTDRPTHIVVYLSYSIDTDTATMIVLYKRTKDAHKERSIRQRLGGVQDVG